MCMAKLTDIVCSVTFNEHNYFSLISITYFTPFIIHEYQFFTRSLTLVILTCFKFLEQYYYFHVANAVSKPVPIIGFV